VSVHVLSWAWRQPLANPTRKLVLLKLADAANDDGVCWPFVGTIARDVGVSVRSVERHVAALREAGLVDAEQQYRDDGSKTFNVYRLVGYRPHPTPVSGTPDTSDPGHPTHVSGLARASGQKEPLEPSVEPDPPNPPGTPATVGRRPVTQPEALTAAGILREFNDVFGTRFTLAAWAAKIISRVREHPELDVVAHRVVLEANATAPWWSGAPSPSVVYGSAAQFERSMIVRPRDRANLSAGEAARLADDEAERLRLDAETVDGEAVEVD
jgi:DNA-binding transcriptional ArsR family regulator